MADTRLPKHDLNNYRAILEGRVADLESGTSRRDEIAIEQTPDEIEQMQRACERALAISNMDRDSRQLRNVRAALRRIREGSFGVCEECEEQISPKRLSAIPWASLCVICQEARDREGTSYSIEQRYAA